MTKVLYLSDRETNGFGCCVLSLSLESIGASWQMRGTLALPPLSAFQDDP